MGATFKLLIKTDEQMPNGEVLFLIRQKLLKRMPKLKKQLGNYVPKSCTVCFELGSKKQYFEKSDYLLFAHQIAKMFGTECRWHTETLIPVFGVRPNLIIHITLTDEG